MRKADEMRIRNLEEQLKELKEHVEKQDETILSTGKLALRSAAKTDKCYDFLRELLCGFID